MTKACPKCGRATAENLLTAGRNGGPALCPTCAVLSQPPFGVGDDIIAGLQEIRTRQMEIEDKLRYISIWVTFMGIVTLLSIAAAAVRVVLR